MRSPESVKEKIASKAFIRALDRNLIAQPLEQGNDFGTDYIVKVFSPEGEYLRRFNVQVKYVAPDHVRHPFWDHDVEWEWSRGLHTEQLTLAWIDLRIESLRQFLNPAITGGNATLLFLANEKDFFYVWLNDWWDWYFAFIPRARDAKGTVRVHVGNARCVQRRAGPGTVFSLLEPSRPEWESGRETFSMHGVTLEEEPIGRFMAPGGVDSLCSLGATLYLQQLYPRLGPPKDFDVAGFWGKLHGELSGRPWTALLFARFVGLLPPTDAMLTWARETIVAWRDWALVPAAFQVLAGAPSPAVWEADLARFHQRVREGYFYVDYLRLVSAGPGASSEPALHRAVTEYMIAACWFWERQLLGHRSPVAQELLIELFFRVSYPDDEGVHVVASLQRIARAGGFLEGASLDGLLRVVGAPDAADRGRLAGAIGAAYNRWMEEARDDR